MPRDCQPVHNVYQFGPPPQLWSIPIFNLQSSETSIHGKPLSLLSGGTVFNRDLSVFCHCTWVYTFFDAVIPISRGIYSRPLVFAFISWLTQVKQCNPFGSEMFASDRLGMKSVKCVNINPVVYKCKKGFSVMLKQTKISTPVIYFFKRNVVTFCSMSSKYRFLYFSSHLVYFLQVVRNLSFIFTDCFMKH